ncbi:Uncharacterised protein [Escherichia coli]|nr:Uncharacterised protein [Escherichia coli]
MNFCLLQANHIRLVLFDDGFKLVRSGAQAVDIKRDKFHSPLPFIQIKSAWMVAEFRVAYRLLLSDLIDGC